MDLYALASLRGLQTEFFDAHGHRRVTGVDALRAILDAMPASSGDGSASPLVVRHERTSQVRLPDAVALPARWRLIDGGRAIASGSTADGIIADADTIDIGIHRLEITDGGGVPRAMPLIVAPPRAFAGDFERGWIFAVQLYGLRSKENWGIGDFGDLSRLIDIAADLGAAGVGLNPLHALFDDRPAECSPYSPNSRLFLNPLYIDVAALPELEPVGGGQRPSAATLAADQVDYVGVAKAKTRALRQAFDRFQAAPTPERKTAFEAFRAERGNLLLRFACFEVLRHRFQTAWWEWPPEWRQPDDAACARLRAGPDSAEIEFIEFVQWCADAQLAACQARARARGMAIGLYLDVAVGVQSGGFDAWNEQAAIARSLSVGAPPDLLNTAGQDWGLAGFNPAGLTARAFAPFRDMMRASMRHAGAIRLDHVLGLQRLYVVPEGFGPADGVYVQMPFEALLAVAAQESVANRCVIIGEDLGTVPEGFRDRLADWGLWSYLVMVFERDHHGAFRPPEHYGASALVTFGTHDLATFAGWRGLSDLQFKRSLGLNPGESDDARRHALWSMGEALRGQGIMAEDFYAVVKFLSATPSRLLAVALEDLLLVIEQPNIPGTVDEHPNWRQRMPVALADIPNVIDRAALADALSGRSIGSKR